MSGKKSLVRVLLEDPLGDRERAVRRGNAAVCSTVEQHFADLVGSEPARTT